MYCSFLYVSKIYGFSYNRPRTSDVITSSTLHSNYTKEGDQAINQQDERVLFFFFSSCAVIYAFINRYYILYPLSFLPFCIFRASYSNISTADDGGDDVLVVVVVALLHIIVEDLTMHIDMLSISSMAHIHQGKVGENGPPVVWLFNSSNPTGPKNGMLSQGNITSNDLVGPLKGKQMSDLVKLINDGLV